MSKRHRLQQLLQEPQIRKAGQGAGRYQTVSTGFPDLDQALPGGWPIGMLTELLVDLCGIGELQLLLPTLIALNGHPTDPKVNARLGQRNGSCWWHRPIRRMPRPWCAKALIFPD